VRCVGCGVCQNLETNKIFDKPYKASKEAQTLKNIEHFDPSTCPRDVKETFRYRIKLTKTGTLRYFSHLDWQNTFFKAISRTNLNVAFSQGFNPTMKISMGVALPLFAQSEGELVDIELWEYVEPDKLKYLLEKVLPKESKIISIVNIDRSSKSIDNTAAWAEYRIGVFNKTLYDFENLKYNTNRVLSSEEIFIEKKNKKGLIKKINIKPSIKSYRFEDDYLFIILKTGQGSDIPALRADILMNIIEPETAFDITRTRFFDENLREL
jgi:radical SAM-linked protein